MFLFSLNYRRKSVSFYIVYNLELLTYLKTRPASVVTEVHKTAKWLQTVGFYGTWWSRKWLLQFSIQLHLLLTNTLTTLTKSVCLEWHWYLERGCHSGWKRELLTSPYKTQRVYFFSLCVIFHWGKMFDFWGLIWHAFSC